MPLLKHILLGYPFDIKHVMWSVSNEKQVACHRNLFAITVVKLESDLGFCKIKRVFPGGLDTLFIHTKTIPTGFFIFLKMRLL